MLWDVDSWSTFRKYKWKILLRSSFFLYLQSQQHRVGPEDQVVNLERCFHWWVNWTNSFPTVSQPCSQTPSRQPTPTGLLSVALWAYSAAWGRSPDWETWAFSRIIPWPHYVHQSGYTCVYTQSLRFWVIRMVVVFIVNIFWLLWSLCERNYSMSLGQKV